MPIYEKFPQLHTERLILREAMLEDAVDAFVYMSDDEVMKGHGRKGIGTLEEAEHLIQHWYRGSYESRLGIRFGIALKEDNRLIGSCGFWRWDREHMVAEIGYELSRAHHRQGIMKEALAAMIAFGFQHMGINRIEARADDKNLASQQTLLSLGFEREGIMREAEFEDGEFVDIHLFSLLRRDYERNFPKDNEQE